MSYEDDLKRMKELATYNVMNKTESQTGDEEKWHYEADQILVRYVPKELAEEWEKVHKWYS